MATSDFFRRTCLVYLIVVSDALKGKFRSASNVFSAFLTPASPPVVGFGPAPPPVTRFEGNNTLLFRCCNLTGDFFLDAGDIVALPRYAYLHQHCPLVLTCLF